MNSGRAFQTIVIRRLAIAGRATTTAVLAIIIT